MRVILLFILGLVLVMLGGSRLVDAAVYLAKKCRVPEAVIGATVVSIATTLPEIAVAATASWAQAPDLAAGCAFGSVICNAALIAGVSLLFCPKTKLKPEPYRWRLVFFVICDAVLFLSAVFLEGFPRVTGCLCAAGFLIYTVFETKHDPLPVHEMAPAKGNAVRQILVFLVSAAFLTIGARLCVETSILNFFSLI